MTRNVALDDLTSMRGSAARLKHNRIISHSVYLQIVRKIDRLYEEEAINLAKKYPI